MRSLLKTGRYGKGETKHGMDDQRSKILGWGKEIAYSSAKKKLDPAGKRPGEEISLFSRGVRGYTFVRRGGRRRPTIQRKICNPIGSTSMGGFTIWGNPL